MYQKVKDAWMVLSENGNNQLFILFEEFPKSPSTPGPTPGESSTYCVVDSNGVGWYGAYDETGKWWSSSASSINRTYQVELVDVTFIEHDTLLGACLRTGAITKPFAEFILKEFNLDFHLEQVDTHWDNLLNWVFVQSGDLVGTTVGTREYGKCEVLEAYVEGGIGRQSFKVRTSNGLIRYLGFRDIAAYKGMTFMEYRKDYQSKYPAEFDKY